MDIIALVVFEIWLFEFTKIPVFHLETETHYTLFKFQIKNIEKIQQKYNFFIYLMR